MAMLVYPPAKLRTLETPRRDGRHRLTDWSMSIVGPLCFWPERSPSTTTNLAMFLADKLSARLHLHVRANTKRNEVTMAVCLTEAERDRLIQDVYDEETEG